MDEQKQIISVKEARKILGKDGEQLTDEQVVKLVDDLDFIARGALKMAREQHEKNRTA